MRERFKQAAMRAPGPIRRGLLRPSYELYLRFSAHRDRRADGPVELDRDGLPVPPLRLRSLVGGEERERPSSGIWLRSGDTDSRLIRRLVERNDRALGDMEAILDFGCGCGRIARWWAELEGPRLFGSDYNRRLTKWCQANLPFITVETNATDPPLRFDDQAFDLVYAISVFTHLPEDSQRRWMAELRRILKPGGLLLFTVHGDRFAGVLPEQERERYERGELVIRYPELSGTNACGAFHPEAYVRNRFLPAAGLELVDSVHEDLSGKPNPVSPLPLQDNYLARKPAAVSAPASGQRRGDR